MVRRAVVLVSFFLVAAGARAAEARAAAFVPGLDLAAAREAFVLDAGEIEARLAADAHTAQAGGEASDPSVAEPSLLQGLDATVAAAAGAQVTPAGRPMAIEYSDGYRTRLKIHKYASYLTLPLFAAQFVVGQKLYDGTGSDSTRSAHSALAAGTAVLFGVNTVTGVWNLREGRKDPNHRNKRLLHGALMLVADAGFVATGALAPDDDDEGQGLSPSDDRSTHRTVAFVSMGVATVAYLIMLIH